ncbi:FHA domain-containing protein [Azoarcus sp. TTM-91]|uniref:Class 3 adenylate cyclase n=1 Tax=Azoarcus indigens TaxID=29545 RepID=A0A4R6E646_9RHOO|nr:FHA domain-containing protein [Azoarcus sp. TTM-91]NMG65408.1 FHA domain-containing protein [Azoarcus indigens]TDN53380.1 class 3 adenylate cyclase [Azoarcus indigens]
MEQSGRTVVFADLTGSTGLFESAGNVAATHVVTRCTQAVGSHLARSGGRVVKYLGDGVLVLFDDTVAAVDACARVQDVLRDLNFGELRSAPLGFKVGIEYGSIVEHDGDSYGDAVNVAARLSDRAEANEILIGESAFNRLPEFRRIACHSLDRIKVKGKAAPIRVWRIDWARTAESTLTIPIELLEAQSQLRSMQRLDLDRLDQHLELAPPDGPLVLGRGEGAGFIVNDPRVSRRHARIEWSGGQCVLTDFSSNGTWVRFPASPTAVMLKRDSCVLHGQGEIGLGATPDDFTAPTLTFQVINDV